MKSITNCLFLILAICNEHYSKTAISFFVKNLLGQQCTGGTSLLSRLLFLAHQRHDDSVVLSRLPSTSLRLYGAIIVANCRDAPWSVSLHTIFFLDAPAVRPYYSCIRGKRFLLYSIKTTVATLL